MNYTVLTGTELKEMFINGYKNLYRAENKINDLNVFPIPDGDTGTNMASTLGGGVCSVKSENGNVSDFMDKFSMATLLHARGNSGVILSQFIRGFSFGCDDSEIMDIECFSKALRCGVEKAYTAVIKPVEGTMLTVIREGVESFEKNNSKEDFRDAFTYLIEEMKLSLSKTPEKLAVLRDAGVVDSGGLGMIYIFEGMKAYIEGTTINIDQEPEEYINTNIGMGTSVAFGPDSVLEYGYCTEFILQLLNSKTDISAFKKEDVIAFMETLGDSIVVVLEGGILKIHIHTFEPEKVLAYARQYGEFISVKIENMSIQHNEFAKEKKKHYKYGVISTANGDGIKDYFLGIGAAKVIDGGQSKNPSAQDFIDAVNEIDAESIIFLPNNSNIVLTAYQAQEMCADKDIHVIPTKSIPEGFSALSMMDPSASTVEEFIEGMTDPLENVTSVSITTAVHDAQSNGIIIKTGEYMGIVDGNIAVSAKDRTDAVIKTLESLSDIDEKQVITIFRGENVSEDDCEKLANTIMEKYPLIEVGILYGGQDIYDFYMAVE